MIANAAHFPSLKDRVVAVTGGASGIGAALVQAFARQSARVAFLDIDADAAERLQAQVQSQTGRAPLFVKADLTVPTELTAAFGRIGAELGPVRALVNNAARDDRQALPDVTPDSWRRALAANLDHYVFAVQAVRPAMAAAGGGSVVNFSSNNAVMGAANMSAYVTAKAGIVGLTRALARELGPDNIRVNAILPGWVMTERQRALWATPQDVAQCLQEQCLAISLTPEDVCGLALFLAADDSRIITKQVFVADAGRA